MKAQYPEFKMNDEQLINKWCSLRKSFKNMNSEKVSSQTDLSGKMSHRYRLMAFLDQEFDQTASGDVVPLQSQIKTETRENSAVENLISDISSIDDLESSDLHNSFDQPELIEHDYVIKHVTNNDSQGMRITTSPKENLNQNIIEPQTYHSEEEYYESTSNCDEISVAAVAATEKALISTSPFTLTTSAITSSCSSDVITTTVSSTCNILSVSPKSIKLKKQSNPSHNFILCDKDGGTIVLAPLNVNIDKTKSTIPAVMTTSSFATPLVAAHALASNTSTSNAGSVLTSTSVFSSSTAVTNAIKTTTVQTSRTSSIVCSADLPLVSRSLVKLETLNCVKTPVVSPEPLKGKISNTTKQCYISSSTLPIHKSVAPLCRSLSPKKLKSFKCVKSPIVSPASLKVKVSSGSKQPCNSTSTLPSEYLISFTPRISKSLTTPNISSSSTNISSLNSTCSFSSNACSTQPTVATDYVPEVATSAYKIPLQNLPSPSISSDTPKGIISVCNSTADSTCTVSESFSNAVKSSSSASNQSLPITFSLPFSKMLTSTSSTITAAPNTLVRTHKLLASSCTPVTVCSTTPSSKVPTTTSLSKKRPTFHYLSQHPTRNRPVRKYKNIGTNTMPPFQHSIGINTELIPQRSIGTITHECSSAQKGTNSDTSFLTVFNPSTSTLIATDVSVAQAMQFHDYDSGVSNCDNLVDSSNLSSESFLETPVVDESVPLSPNECPEKGTCVIPLHSNKIIRSPASNSLMVRKRQRSVSPDCSLCSGDMDMHSEMEENMKKPQRAEADEKDTIMFVKLKPKSSSTSLLGSCFNVTSSVNREMQAAVVAEEDADSLTKEELDFVHAELVNFLKQALLSPNSPELRFQNYRVIEPGWLLCTCQNTISLEWLLTLKPMTGPGGRMLRVIRASDLPWPSKIKFLVNSQDTDAVLSLLQQQNKRLKVSKWKILDKKEENEGAFFTFLIDPESERAIEYYQWRLCYEFTTIKIHLEGHES